MQNVIEFPKLTVCSHYQDRSKCGCFKGLSEKMTGNGDPYPLWTVETLWQGAVSRSRTQTLSVCMEPMVAVPSALIAFHGVRI